ncbi:hypothetical protein BGZ80_008509, partial [Entomortierella chlamydospora]
SALESIGLASKRACLDIAGLIPSARKLIFGNACAIRTDKHYAAPQKEFIACIELGAFEDGINSAVLIVNWLCLIQAERNPRWSIVMSKKSAIIALFVEPMIVAKDPVFVAFMNPVKKVTVHDSKAIDFNVRTVLEHFRSLPIIKYVTISPHVDKTLCPISAYQTYVARLPQPLVPVPHQKGSCHSIVPLIRYFRDASKATGAVRIRVFHNEISRLMFVEGTEIPSKSDGLRPMGSSLAAMTGVPIANTMVQWYWSSPKIF